MGHVRPTRQHGMKQEANGRPVQRERSAHHIGTASTAGGSIAAPAPRRAAPAPRHVSLQRACTSRPRPPSILQCFCSSEAAPHAEVHAPAGPRAFKPREPCLLRPLLPKGKVRSRTTKKIKISLIARGSKQTPSSLGVVAPPVGPYARLPAQVPHLRRNRTRGGERLAVGNYESSGGPSLILPCGTSRPLPSRQAVIPQKYGFFVAPAWKSIRLWPHPSPPLPGILCSCRSPSPR